MTEYTVHFQKGSIVGTRQLRMVTVYADTVADAIKAAKAEFNGEQARGFKMTRVDHYDDETNRMTIDVDY